MGDEAKRLERVEKLLESLRDVQAREFEIVEELQRVVSGERSLSTRAVDVLKVFGAAWAARYGAKWQHGGAKDGALAKRLVKELDDEDISHRIERYLRDATPFYARERHPFSLFCSQVNRFASIGVETLDLTGASLAEDADATQRYVEELRTGVRRGKS